MKLFYVCMLLYVHSSIAIILTGKRELVALLNLSSWCLVMVEWPLLVVLWGCFQFVIVVFPDHTHLLFWGVDSTPKNGSTFKAWKLEIKSLRMLSKFPECIVTQSNRNILKVSARKTLLTQGFW